MPTLGQKADDGRAGARRVQGGLHPTRRDVREPSAQRVIDERRHRRQHPVLTQGLELGKGWVVDGEVSG